MDAIEELAAAYEEGRSDEDMAYSVASRIHNFSNVAAVNYRLNIPYHTLCENMESRKKRSPAMHSMFESFNFSGYNPGELTLPLRP